MLKLLSDIEDGKYQAVLCMDIDRLGRGVMSQQGIILETIKAADVKIITPRKVYDLNNDIDEEYTEFQAFFARRELKTINRRLQRGLEKTIKDGGYIANAPYGYEKCTINKLPSLKIVEEEAKFVRMIFDMYVNQGYGSHTIAETLNSLGATPRRTDHFGRTTIRTIIKNEVYIGKIIWNKTKTIKSNSSNEISKTINKDESTWIIADGLHKPIIDEELFYRAQNIRVNKIHPPAKRNKITNQFAGLLFCGNCNSRMQLIRSKGKSTSKVIPYLGCNNKGCIKSTKLSHIDDGMFESMNKFVNDLKLQMSTNLSANTDNKHITDALATISKDILTANTQKEKLHDLLEQGVYDIDMFVSRNKILDDKIKKLQVTQKQLEAQIKVESVSIEDKIKKLDEIIKIYKTADAQTKNDLLKSIINAITYHKESDWGQTQFVLNVDYK